LEYEHGFKDYGITNTPTVIHFKDGKVQARIVGAHTTDEFVDWFTANVK